MGRYSGKLLVFALLFVVGVSTPRNAYGQLALSGVGTLNLESVKREFNGTAATTSGKAGIGLGALLTIPAGSLLSLETGALLINRKYESAGTTLAFGRLQFPLLLKFSALPIISFGAGPYLEMGFGDITQTTAAGASTNFTYDAANFDSTDIGLCASVNADLPLAPFFKLTLDARYNMGLNDLDRSTNDSLKFGGLQFLAGLKFVL